MGFLFYCSQSYFVILYTESVQYLFCGLQSDLKVVQRGCALSFCSHPCAKRWVKGKDPLSQCMKWPQSCPLGMGYWGRVRAPLHSRVSQIPSYQERVSNSESVCITAGAWRVGDRGSKWKWEVLDWIKEREREKNRGSEAVEEVFQRGWAILWGVVNTQWWAQGWSCFEQGLGLRPLQSRLSHVGLFCLTKDRCQAHLLGDKVVLWQKTPTTNTSVSENTPLHLQETRVFTLGRVCSLKQHCTPQLAVQGFRSLILQRGILTASFSSLSWLLQFDFRSSSALQRQRQPRSAGGSCSFSCHLSEHTRVNLMNNVQSH